jgi:hypothetical protein
MIENFDIVVKILKIGLSGFVFLLVFMAFRLLRKEQNVDTPRPIFLKKISQFMWISVVLVIIVGVFSLSETLLKNTFLKPKKHELWEVKGLVKLDRGETGEIKGLEFTIQPPDQLPQPDGSFSIKGVPIYKTNGMEMPKLVVRKEGYSTVTVDLDPEIPKDEALPEYNIALNENEKEIRISRNTPIILRKKLIEVICSKCIKECPEYCKKEEKPLPKYEGEKGEKAQKAKAEDLPEYKAKERKTNNR